MVAGARFRRERMAAAAADELIAATDLADLLVKRGTPFREAHGVIAGLVREAVESGRPLAEVAVPALGEDAARGARALLVAGVEGQRGRDVAGARPRAARARPRAAVIDLAFYDRPVLEVAPDLIGCVVRHGDTAGVIVETEAYHRSEPASHAWAGLTARTEPLFGPPGIAYVYRSYGIHALLNAVCDHVDSGAAVLIRALRAARRHRGHARAPARRARRGAVQRPGQAHAGARHRPRAQPHLAARRADPHRAARARLGGAGARRRQAHRDHEGRRPRLALLRARQPPRVAAVAAGARAQRRLSARRALRRAGAAAGARAAGAGAGRRAACVVVWAGGCGRRARAAVPARRRRCPCRCPSPLARAARSAPAERPARRRRPRAPGAGLVGMTGAGVVVVVWSSGGLGGSPLRSRSLALRSSAMALALTMKSCQIRAG